MPHASNPPNILAVRFSSIGDILLTTPLLRAIRHSHAGAGITVLTRREYVPLLSHNPHVTRVLGLSPTRSLFNLATELRGERFSHLLDLHDSLRSRALRMLVPGRWRSYPKHRLDRAMLIRTKRNRYRDRRPVAERYFSAARELGVRPDGNPPEFFLGPEAAEQVAAWLNSRGLENESIVAVAPGAAHATKRWPIEHWRALVNQNVAAGFAVVVVGGPADADLGAALADGGRRRVVSAAGLFGLQATGALLQRSRAVVSGDTGVMHMATGVGTPVVALFGPTVEAFGFFPYFSRATVLELPLPCRPCTTQGGPRCPLGHHRCLSDLHPDAVYAALRRTVA